MHQVLTAVQRLRRQRKFYSWTGATLVGGILLLLNFVMSYVPLRLDTSEGHVYSLSKGSKALLREFHDTLLFKFVCSSKLPPPINLNEQYIRDLLAEYKRASHGKIRIEYVDPAASPKGKQEAMGLGVMPVQLDVRDKDRREVRESFMGLALLYGDKKESIPFIQDTNGLEYEITQRIKKLIRPGQANVGIVTNGKALTLASEPLQVLSAPIQELYSVRNVDLAQEDIPTDLKSLWVIGPSEEIPAAQVQKIRDYVKNGGSLGLLIDRYNVEIQQFRSSPFKSGLEDLLREWGIDFRNGFVVDPRCDRIQLRTNQGFFQMINVIDYPYFPLVTDVNRSHPATQSLDGFSMPFASPLIIEKEIPGLKITPLAKSSPQSWLDPVPFNVSPLQNKPKPDGATEGPFNLGVTVDGNFGPTDKPNPPSGRVILFGCSRFIRSDFPPKNSNYSLFLNLLDWSVQDEFLLSIRSKGVARRPLKALSDMVRLSLKYSMILFLPIASLMIGLVVWRHQKKRLGSLPHLYREA